MSKVVVHSILTKMVHPSRLDRIEDDAALSDLSLDPIDRAYTLPLELEERFGIEITDAQIENWKTVGDVVRSVSGELVA